LFCSINEGSFYEEPVVEAPSSVPVPAVPVPKPTHAPALSIPKKPTKDENLAKLKNMTSDFFSDM
jgi:hypothetical protein